LPINLNSAYTVEMTSVNGSTPFNGSLTVDDMSVVSATVSGTDIIVKVYTDNYPSETGWEIRNSATNALLASGGPYIGAGGTAAGGPDALQTKTQSITLPAGNNCYKVIMTDSYGDGFGYGVNPAGQFGMEIVSGSNTILNLNLGNFGSILTRDAAMKTDETSSISELDAVNFNVFPNPSNGICNVTMNMTKNEDVSIRVYNMLGSLVSSRDLGSLTPGDYIYQVDLSTEASGVYSMMMITSQGVQTQLISINR
jgi:hypothetical protein